MKKATIYALVTVLFLMMITLSFYQNNPYYKAKKYIAEWENMGSYMPADQIPFFAKYFSKTKDILAGAMFNPNSDIRQCAAYVISELGPQAKPLEAEILNALQQESDCIVRLYFYNALRFIEADGHLTLAYLENRFLQLSQQQGAPSNGKLCKSSDEIITIAAALFVINDGLTQKQKYLDEILQWLKPPCPVLSSSEVEAYWENRLTAVNVLEYMIDAEGAIPLLEKMLSEQPTKPWVSVHVPRVLSSLRGDK
jgi:hypothetical protein